MVVSDNPAGQDWAAMQPEQFDTQARQVQGALFAEAGQVRHPRPLRRRLELGPMTATKAKTTRL